MAKYFEGYVNIDGDFDFLVEKGIIPVPLVVMKNVVNLGGPKDTAIPVLKSRWVPEGYLVLAGEKELTVVDLKTKEAFLVDVEEWFRLIKEEAE